MNLKQNASLLIGVMSAVLLTSCSHFVNRQKDQERAKLYLQKGVDLFNDRQYTAAIDATFDAIKYDPKMASAYNHLALIFMETKRYPKAEEAFRKALELEPDYPEVFNNYGVLMNREERYREAVTYFEKALQYDRYSTPENAYTNLGYSHFKLGSLTRAKAFHQKALDISPLFCLASKNMGDVYAKEKAYGRASEYFQKATTNCPLFQEAEYKLGLVLMKTGNRGEARAHLEKLVQRHKTGPYVDRSHEVLKYLH